MITTKFLGPTNHRGSRIKATGPFGSVTVSYDSALDNSANYDAAVKAYCDKHPNSCREYIRGIDASGHNYVYIATTCPKVIL